MVLYLPSNKDILFLNVGRKGMLNMNQAVLGITILRRLSFVRILRLATGGAIGGLATFLVFNPFIQGGAMFGDAGADANWLTTGPILGAAVGLMIGACLIASEEWYIRKINRTASRALIGGLAGAICGALGGLDGQFMFAFFGYLNVLTARCISWALMGAAAGICPGLVSRSRKRAELGACGGLIGGATGGVLFDILRALTRNGDLSRVLGLMLVGAAIGIAVGLVEEVAKEYWLTVLNGVKEGQSFVLSKDETTVGRSETVDIPLFGDNAVDKLHARFMKSDSGVQLMAEVANRPVVVNSQPVSVTALSDGDIIGIGKHRLRFGTRHTAPGMSAAQPIQETSQAESTMLHVMTGPHKGQSFALLSPSMPIGRSPECSISLPGDTRISREHARIFWDGSVWRVEDCRRIRMAYS